MIENFIVCNVDAVFHIVLRSADIYLYAEFLTLALCLTCYRKGSDNNDRLSGMLYKAAGKISKYRSLNVILSAVVCPIVNTGLFVLGMVVFFGDAFLADAAFGSLAASSSNILAFVITVLVGVNFFVELALNVIVCPVVAKALFNSKVFKKN